MVVDLRRQRAGAGAAASDLPARRPLRRDRRPARRRARLPARAPGHDELHPAPALRPHALSPLPGADAAGGRAARPVGLRPGDLVEPRRRQGGDHRAQPAARELRALADALRLGPAAPVPERVGPHPRLEARAAGPAGAWPAALPAQLGPALGQWRRHVRGQLGLHRQAHPQGLSARGAGDPPAGRHRPLHAAHRQGRLLPQRLASGALQARAADRRGVCRDARSAPGGDRRRA